MYKRKILVTGGAGFIGSAISEKLIQNKENYVVVVDNFLTGNRLKLPAFETDNWKFIKCNVNDKRDISIEPSSMLRHIALILHNQR